jgi:DNA polymerase III, delta subunit
MSRDVTIFNTTLAGAQPLACRLLEAAVAQGKVANAYLLAGRAHDDKLQLARQAACYFNCRAADRDQAGACVTRPLDPALYCMSCQWITAGEHPQAWLILDGEGKSQKVPVEKARLLTEELAKTSAFVRVVIVPQAGEATFHRPAANALLKCIEEPPPNVLFFFLADSAEEVLATIVSRCQVIPLSSSLPLGYWLNAHSGAGSGATPGLPVELVTKLEAARADFSRECRQHFGNTTDSHQYFKTISQGLALSRQLQELSKELQEALDEQQAGEQVLDLFINAEMEALKDVSAADPLCSRYLQKLLELVERSKRQINQYVKQNNALESFALTLIDLRQSYLGLTFDSAHASGDISLAKR